MNDPLRTAITAALQTAGDPGPYRVARDLGGSQSAVQLVAGARGEYVLKHGMPAAMAAAEARGLALLRRTDTVRVPAVLGHGEAPPFVLLEYLAPDGPLDAAHLGRELAALHRQTGEHFGLDHDNFIGRTPQPNTPHDDWPTFFREMRLRPQLELAAERGRLPRHRRQRLAHLMDRLPELLGHDPAPSLIHGDLWHGNVLAGPDGAPAIIDPAVSHSDREAELAFTKLFGGLPGAFYDAYHEAWPLPSGWRERAEVYNLYHLLNHLNLFGESYGSAVDGVLKRFVT